MRYTPVIDGIPLGASPRGRFKGGFAVRPMAAALIGALISGVAMYAIGARAQDRFAMNPAMVGTPAMVGNPGMVGNPAMVGGPAMAYYAAQGYTQPLAQPVAYLTTTPQPYAQPVYYTPAPQVAAPAPQVVQRRVAAPRQTVSRTAEPSYSTVEAAPHRSLAKTALIIGGTAASGAGVGGIVGGKKGALLGAAIGGGAASIYEATRR